MIKLLGPLKFLLGIPQAGLHGLEGIELKRLKQLSLFEKLLHRKVHKHIMATICGLLICIIGSVIAEHHGLSPAWCWDTVASSLQAGGFVPIAVHIERLFDIFIGE